MAEGILYDVADRILWRLGSLPRQEIGLLCGVKKELKKLVKTLSTIRAVLVDAEERQFHSHQIKDWLEKLEEVVNEADDLLDEFDTEVSHKREIPGNDVTKQVRTFFSNSNQLVFRHKIGHKVIDIRKKLAFIAADRYQFGLEERNVKDNPVVSRGRETHSFQRQEDVIGRDEQKQAISKFVLENKMEENISVTAITGLGGLGKTTLAQLIFNDEEISKHFELKMWVCNIPDLSDLKQVSMSIIKSLPDNNPTNLDNLDHMLKHLREKINKNRYLLVLDDVWKADHKNWLDLESLLKNHVGKNWIILTTRNEAVARAIGDVQLHPLMMLDEDQSWSLFKRVALKKGQELSNFKSEQIGKEIVSKCCGNPLALRTIANLLYSKDPQSEWTSFLATEFSKMPQEPDDILPTLELSYYHLSSHLKHCFAYCSLFPKNYETDVQMLIQLWMAQGFIEATGKNLCPEDIGYEYFTSLLWGSCFQDIKRDGLGNVTTCKMHDLMHDLAMKVAGRKCVALRSNEEKVDNRTHYISIIFGLDFSQGLANLAQAKRIKTLILSSKFMSCASCMLGKTMLDTIVSSHTFLRALVLYGLQIGVVPASISKLIHLRYLDLSRNDMKELPNSLCGLHNLQTLKVNGCSSLQELPKSLKKLGNMRHLEIDKCVKLSGMPCGLGQLTNLQILSMFVCSSRCGLNELKGLNYLRGELKIGNLGGKMDSKNANMKAKQHLQSLALTFRKGSGQPVDDEMTLDSLETQPNLKRLTLTGYGGFQFSSWISTLTNLVELMLLECDNCQSLPPLSHVPSLKMLKLEKLRALEHISSESLCYSSTSMFFPSLQDLHLERLPILKGWWAKDEDRVEWPWFPCLSKLFIQYCPNLNSMPLYPFVQGGLIFRKTGWKPFLQTLMLNKRGPRIQATIDEPLPSSLFSGFPLTKLTSLSLSFIGDIECLPESGGGLSSLKSLYFDSCPELRSLSPGIQYLTSLEYLHIQYCDEFQGSSDANVWQPLRSLRSLIFTHLPKLDVLPEGVRHLTSLQQLDIEDCDTLKTIPDWISDLKSLKSLSIDNSLNAVSLTAVILNLTSLQSMVICGCHNLRYLPKGINNLRSLEELRIGDCSALELSNDEVFISQALISLRCLHFKDIPKLQALPGGLSMLTSLEKLVIEGCEMLVAIPEFNDNLKSLKYLHISDCPLLTSLPKGLQHLTGLQELNIWCCNSLVVIPDSIENLNSLKEVYIWNCPKLTLLPDGLQGVSSLQRLTMKNCENLMSITTSFNKLRSLQYLLIEQCPELTSLPDGLQNLTSLQSLVIENCPKTSLSEEILKLASLRYL